MWPMGLSHVKQGVGERSGWSRQQNQKVLPVADKMAAVDMRLAPHAYRELHWHTAVSNYLSGTYLALDLLFIKIG